MTSWGEYSAYSPDKVKKLLQHNAAQADYYRFLQFHADRQLREVREHCHRIGVALKGDIPIGISRTSVDAWIAPELFNLDASAGAPAGRFCHKRTKLGISHVQLGKDERRRICLVESSL